MRFAAPSSSATPPYTLAMYRISAVAGGLTGVLFGCGAPVVKQDAFDTAILERPAVPPSQIDRSVEEIMLQPGAVWFPQVDATTSLTFAGYRREPGDITYVLVLACRPDDDRLVLLPLADGESPLDALADSARCEALRQAVSAFADAGQSEGSIKTGAVEVSLSEVIDSARLGPPLPSPAHVFAVAANIPSHLRHDLALADIAEYRSHISVSRPRVFISHPLVFPPEAGAPREIPFTGIIGPYDALQYPSAILLPPKKEGEPFQQTSVRLDYEVEIGAVIGRQLTWEWVQNATDDELREAVAGLVLCSDAKARNPQVMLRAKALDEHVIAQPPYGFDDDYLDAAASGWESETCQWWSYAATWGDYTAIGPFFVASGDDLDERVRGLISARTYGAPNVRGESIPTGRSIGTFYLRQCGGLTTDIEYADAMYWNIPQIIRSIVEPGGALSFMDEPIRIEAGDIICLGTPGGTVITSKPHGLLEFLERLIFFWRPINFHDAFFKKDANLYLRTGDRLFLWAEGLGYQLLNVREVKVDLSVK